MDATDRRPRGFWDCVMTKPSEDVSQHSPSSPPASAILASSSTVSNIPVGASDLTGLHLPVPSSIPNKTYSYGLRSTSARTMREGSASAPRPNHWSTWKPDELQVSVKLKNTGSHPLEVIQYEPPSKRGQSEQSRSPRRGSAAPHHSNLPPPSSSRQETFYDDGGSSSSHYPIHNSRPPPLVHPSTLQWNPPNEVRPAYPPPVVISETWHNSFASASTTSNSLSSSHSNFQREGTTSSSVSSTSAGPPTGKRSRGDYEPYSRPHEDLPRKRIAIQSPNNNHGLPPRLRTARYPYDDGGDLGSGSEEMSSMVNCFSARTLRPIEPYQPLPSQELERNMGNEQEPPFRSRAQRPELTTPDTPPLLVSSLPSESKRTRPPTKKTRKRTIAADGFSHNGNAAQRRAILEADPFIAEVEQQRVLCRGCKWVKLDVRKDSKGNPHCYYLGNWQKHKDGFSGRPGCAGLGLYSRLASVMEDKDEAQRLHHKWFATVPLDSTGSIPLWGQVPVRFEDYFQHILEPDSNAPRP